ncbi:MAG: transposase [Candidatus Pacebacteria bacterium]|nr:transposase [Candidatus Paceibacterota bacterium]NUM65207.1 transposase [candidate division KSB1 bacterium]
MKYKALQAKKAFVAGKFVAGIDPGKKKQQICLNNPQGLHAQPFRVDNSYSGYHDELWRKLKALLPEESHQDCVFAIETSCNLWQNLAHYLHRTGHTVVLVSPLTTYQSRPLIGHSFSHTDPKDALLMANNAQSGYFDRYQPYDAGINAMHELAMIYAKNRQSLLQHRLRTRAYVEYVFPEFFQVVDLDTVTARFLLKEYFLPQHYLGLDIEVVGAQLAQLSNRQYGVETLRQLKLRAQHSIGIPKSPIEETAGRLALESWITVEEYLRAQQQKILNTLLLLAKATPYFEILASLKGIGEVLAALFIAETRDLAAYSHYKQIEKLAGFNLRLIESGNYSARKRISHIGNARLAWVLYKMVEETAKYVPEVRIKFIKRQLHEPRYRKNLIACVPVLLSLIMSMVKRGGGYEVRPEKVKELNKLEAQYAKRKKQKTKNRKD